MDVPAGVTQEGGPTGFLIHLLSAGLVIIFLARRIQPFLSLIGREVEFCVLNGLAGANPAVNTPRPSRGTRIESSDFIVLIGDP